MKNKVFELIKQDKKNTEICATLKIYSTYLDRIIKEICSENNCNNKRELMRDLNDQKNTGN